MSDISYQQGQTETGVQFSIGRQAKPRLPSGCRLTYQGNILYCALHKTFEENYQTAIEALCLLLGFRVLPDDILDEVKAEVYKSRG